MKLLFILDPLPALKTYKDTSFAMMVEAARRGHELHYTLQEGMLVVDLVSAGDNHLVWRGTAEGVFKFGEDSVAKQNMITGVLHDMFAGFPPR